VARITTRYELGLRLWSRAHSHPHPQGYEVPALNFTLTKIIVADIDAMEQFYIRTLGLSRIAYLEHGEGDTAFKEVILGTADASQVAAKISFVQYLAKASPTPGEAIVAFMVDDVAAVLAAMCDAGGAVAVPVQDIPEHRLKLAYVTDPEGHMVEIMQAL